MNLNVVDDPFAHAGPAATAVAVTTAIQPLVATFPHNPGYCYHRITGACHRYSTLHGTVRRRQHVTVASTFAFAFATASAIAGAGAAAVVVTHIDASVGPFEKQHLPVRLAEGGVEAEVHRKVVGRAERRQGELDHEERSLSVVAVVDVLDSLTRKERNQLVLLFGVFFITISCLQNSETRISTITVEIYF